MNGVIALLEHIRAWNAGELKHPKRPGSHSEHLNWADLASDESERLVMPAPYFLMENALEALRALTQGSV